MVVGLVLMASGCRQPTVGVKLLFPSELAFLHAAVARIDVYDGSDVGDRSPDAICRSLSTTPPAPPTGVTPLATSGNTEICSFIGGGVVLADVGVGRRVVFVEAEDFGSQARDLGATAVVTVPLAILPAFPAGPAGCQTVAEKCDEAVPCRP